MLDPHVRSVLDGAFIPHLATVQPDGSPHAAPVDIGTHSEDIVLFTGPDKRKARKLRRGPRLGLFIAPTDNPFEPVTIRGRVIDWIQDDTSWAIVDRIVAKGVDAPYPRHEPRVVAVIVAEQQLVGIR